MAVVADSLIVRVAKTGWLSREIVSVWLEAPELAKRTKPGQFFGVKVREREDLLLRRPISVADVQGDLLRLVFRVVGKGTRALSRSRCNEEWDVLGPLGRPAPLVKNKDVIVCAGGVGAAPLLFLTRKLIAKNRVWILIGARTKQELILIPEFRQLGARVLVTTEDGCAGKKGLVTELLTGVVKDLAKPVIYACGPKMMLKGIIEIAGRVQVWGFIEERLGCGAGICYCCGIEKREGGYLRLCQEGPVVDLSRVVL